MVELQYDVNGDGKVDIVDVNALLQMVEEGQDLGPEFDYNRDGKVDIVDVNWLYQNYENVNGRGGTKQSSIGPAAIIVGGIALGVWLRKNKGG